MALDSERPTKKIFNSISKYFKEIFDSLSLDQTFLLTATALALPAFWGMNDGFECEERMKGVWSLLSDPPGPVGRRRSKEEI